MNYQTNLPLAKYRLSEIIAEWRRQRREYFLRLHTGAEKMSYSRIAREHDLTRQAVSQLIKKA